MNKAVLSAGTVNGTIIHNHVCLSNHIVSIYSFINHQEILGLKWSPDGQQLASGTNNQVAIWGIDNNVPLFRDTHVSSVKALSWNPFLPNILASGGGLMDCNITIWNTLTGKCLSTTHTSYQVIIGLVLQQ